MNTVSTAMLTCDMCGNDMNQQATGVACFPCKNFIHEHEMHRYTDHVFVQCNECGELDESGFISDHGQCIECEELENAN